MDYLCNFIPFFSGAGAGASKRGRSGRECLTPRRRVAAVASPWSVDRRRRGTPRATRAPASLYLATRVLAGRRATSAVKKERAGRRQEGSRPLMATSAQRSDGSRRGARRKAHEALKSLSHEIQCVIW